MPEEANATPKRSCIVDIVFAVALVIAGVSISALLIYIGTLQGTPWHVILGEVIVTIAIAGGGTISCIKNARQAKDESKEQ